MKVVINTCYGGFGLSPLGVKAYLQRKGKDAFFYEQTKYSFQKDGVDEYTKVEASSHNKSRMIYTTTKDLGEKFNKFPDYEAHFSYYEIERNDVDLVAVVEELKDKANGSCAKLKVVVIPDDIEWEIDEYDGMEHVEEVHQTWG